MTGTIINIIAVILGSTIGMLVGAQLPEKIRQTVVAGLGLFTAALGFTMASSMQQPLVVLGALLVGGILGEWWGLEDLLRSLGAWLERRFGAAEPQPVSNSGPSAAGDTAPASQTAHPGGSRFIRGFLTASLVFCIGPMAILGSINDGLTGDYSLLAIKSVLDGFASLAFASSLGIGVMFSALVILVYQGGISLLASQAASLITDPMMNEMIATGGILLIGIAISGLLEIKNIRVANFLPALFIAPLVMALLAALGVI
jgi:uncharacterized protein